MYPISRTYGKLSYCNRYEYIIRINPKNGATERKRILEGGLDNSLKRDGWKLEVKKGARQTKTKR